MKKNFVRSDVRVMLLMPAWEASFEERLFGVADTLRRRGYAVDFCVLMEGMQKRGELHLPGLPENRLSLPGFQQRKAVAVRSLNDLYRHLLSVQMVVMGSGKGLERVVDVIRKVQVPFLQLNDIGHYIIPYYDPDFLVLNAGVVKDNMQGNVRIPDEKIAVIGDLRFDKVGEPLTEAGRESFYARYRLCREKPFVVFCSGAVQRIEPWVAELYRRIVADVKKSPFDVILRLHPNDYAGHKKETTLGDVSARVLYPDVPFLEPGDWLPAMKMCAAMAVVESTCKFEGSVFNKHVIAVNSHEWCLTDEGRAKEIFPRKRFDGFGLKGPWKDPQTGAMFSSEFLRKDIGMYRTEGIRWADYTWLGADCHIDELPEVLASPDMHNVDQKLRAEHLAKYWYKIDGKAAERTVDRVDRMAADPQLQARMSLSRSQRILKSCPWLIRQRARDVKRRLTATLKG